jgi:hypothetical protein
MQPIEFVNAITGDYMLLDANHIEAVMRSVPRSATVTSAGAYIILHQRQDAQPIPVRDAYEGIVARLGVVNRSVAERNQT